MIYLKKKEQKKTKTNTARVEAEVMEGQFFFSQLW